VTDINHVYTHCKDLWGKYSTSKHTDRQNTSILIGVKRICPWTFHYWV